MLAAGSAEYDAHPVEALQSELLRDLRVLRAQRLIGRCNHGELETESLGVVEAKPVAVALGCDSMVGEARSPEVDGAGRTRRAR